MLFKIIQVILKLFWFLVKKFLAYRTTKSPGWADCREPHKPVIHGVLKGYEW